VIKLVHPICPCYHVYHAPNTTPSPPLLIISCHYFDKGKTQFTWQKVYIQQRKFRTEINTKVKTYVYTHIQSNTSCKQFCLVQTYHALYNISLFLTNLNKMEEDIITSLTWNSSELYHAFNIYYPPCSLLLLTSQSAAYLVISVSL